MSSSPSCAARSSASLKVKSISLNWFSWCMVVAVWRVMAVAVVAAVVVVAVAVVAAVVVVVAVVAVVVTPFVVA